jgi:hypothetical protein
MVNHGRLDAGIMFRTLLLLAVAAAVIWLYFDRERDVVVGDKTTVAEQTPIGRLSAFVDAHHDRIFGPLSADDTVVSAQEISQIESTLRDLQTKASGDREKKIYATGMQLCGLLQQGLAAREEHARRLAEMGAKGFEAPLASPEQREAEIEKRRRFFEAGVERSWESAADKLRAEVARLYDYLRLLER